MAEVELGLEGALAGGPLASIGVDTWGVDYGLLDEQGALIAPPFSYRDARTDGWRATVDRLGEQRLYASTGVQLMPINTVFQLAVHPRAELARAAALLMLPELVVHHLTGAITAEITSAATTGLVSLATDTWDDALLDDIGVSSSLFRPIAPSGTRVGDWRGVPVHLVGGHDTASAVRTRQGRRGLRSAFVSTGTWVLVGVESDAPITSEAARAANFSNERSVDGRYRVLKNVTGLWLLERCRVAWGDPPISALVEAAAAAPVPPLVNPDDVRFAHAGDMAAEIAAATGLSRDDWGGITRCVIESVAGRVAAVVGEVGAVTGTPVDELDVFGGAIQIEPLMQALRHATGLPILIGVAEATALGNASEQFDALSGRRVAGSGVLHSGTLTGIAHRGEPA